MKKKIDIEKLLQWAVREELPKGSAVAASGWDLITSFGQLGTIVSSGGGVPEFGFVPGAPHEDALTVAGAIRGLDRRARFETIDQVLPLFGDLAAIAGDAAQAILCASFDQSLIVISKATQSTRPPWKFEHPTPRQIWTPFRDKVGALRERPLVHGIDADGCVIYLKANEGRARERDGMYSYAMSPRSPLDWRDPSLISIGHARAEYVAWHRALVMLAENLAHRLKEFEPTPPAAAALPWITGQTPPPRVLPDGLPPGVLTVKLPLQPKRRAPGKPIESDIERRSRQAKAEGATDRRRRRDAQALESTGTGGRGF